MNNSRISSPVNSSMEYKLQIRILLILGYILRALELIGISYKNGFHTFGFGLVSNWLGNLLFHSENKYVIDIGPQNKSRITFFLNDKYWSPLILPWAKYENEVASVLELILDSQMVFLDCGANIGYWSAYASARLPANHIIAVEATPTTFEQLKQNSSVNNDFVCIQAAISDKDDDRVWLSGKMHATMSITDHVEAKQISFQCDTITLDSLFKKYVDPAQDRIIIKLDVEGAEVKALEGATELLKLNPLIIYEDHGKDRDSVISHYISEKLGYQLFAWDNAEGIKKVTLTEIGKLKKHRIGYNFFACDPSANWFR